MGYQNVRHYAGGIADWIEHGGAIEPVQDDRTNATQAVSRRSATVSPPPRERILGRFVNVLANGSLGALLELWLGIVVGCGLLYWLAAALHLVSLREGNDALAFDLHGLGTSLYFSLVTATSVGYGDVAPVGFARAVAGCESAIALLIFGCIISKLVSRRQEQLVEEIHLLTFEDRLVRVRTNLHMVLAELQAIDGECESESSNPVRMLPRLESAAMVFAGELHTVHDLLYRPQRVPEEMVLESILANVAAGLRGITDLLAPCLGDHDSSVLKNGLRTMGNLAAEICGDCVPRQYTPELRVWMDRIHDLAKKVSAAGQAGHDS